MRMLAYRNLGWGDIAVMFLEVAGRYWSTATYGQVGIGRIRLTPNCCSTTRPCWTCPPVTWPR
jgi:hypothetical protein